MPTSLLGRRDLSTSDLLREQKTRHRNRQSVPRMKGTKRLQEPRAAQGKESEGLSEFGPSGSG